jgi:hypothetical protein
MSKNRLNQPKFTMTDFKDENKKCSDWAEILTTVSSHFFKNLLPSAIFSYIALLKIYHIEWTFFAEFVIVSL